MKTKILDYVREKGGGVSMVELSRDIPGFNGNRAMFSGEGTNIVVWNGISQEAIDALAELVQDNQIEVKATQPFVYLIDGGGLDLPLAKRTNHHYKKPHWLPVAISLPKVKP